MQRWMLWRQTPTVFGSDCPISGLCLLRGTQITAGFFVQRGEVKGPWKEGGGWGNAAQWQQVAREALNTLFMSWKLFDCYIRLIQAIENKAFCVGSGYCLPQNWGGSPRSSTRGERLFRTERSLQEWELHRLSSAHRVPQFFPREIVAHWWQLNWGRWCCWKHSERGSKILNKIRWALNLVCEDTELSLHGGLLWNSAPPRVCNPHLCWALFSLHVSYEWRILAKDIVSYE